MSRPIIDDPILANYYDKQLLPYYTDHYVKQGYDLETATAYAVRASNLVVEQKKQEKAAATAVTYPQQQQQQQQQHSFVRTISKKPVYTSVPMKKPEVASSEWPPSLKSYLSRVFTPEATNTPARKEAIEKKVRQLIASINKNNALWTTDWDKMPLISLDDDGAAAANYAKVTASQPYIGSTSSSNSANIGFALPPAAKKIKQNVIFKPSSPSPEQTQSPPPKKKFQFIPISSPSSPISSTPANREEIDKRQKRSERFETVEIARQQEKLVQNRINDEARRAFLQAGAAGNQHVHEWDSETIIGTNQELEKNYLRLTSAPDPSTVRPFPVLVKTLAHLQSKWSTDQNYTYACDQFKSLRQDLTVQRIKNEFTVQVYEAHARIALQMGDLGEYNQCQAVLKDLYGLSITGNVDEFIAYRILYMIHTMNKLDLGTVISNLTPTQKTSSEPIKHALAIRTAVSLGDYHSFFKLYESAPNYSTYLISQFVDRERLKAMCAICKAYRPTVPISFLIKELGFAGFVECRKWFKNTVGLLVGKKGGEIECRGSLGVFVAKLAECMGKVDIKGQI